MGGARAVVACLMDTRQGQGGKCSGEVDDIAEVMDRAWKRCLACGGQGEAKKGSAHRGAVRAPSTRRRGGGGGGVSGGGALGHGGVAS